jgi:hypothetical protein
MVENPLMSVFYIPIHYHSAIQSIIKYMSAKICPETIPKLPVISAATPASMLAIPTAGSSPV